MNVNYRHGYHAGNIADVFKHTVLLQLIASMQRKDKGFLYLDTHAGRGQYDLKNEQGTATNEWQQGIATLHDWAEAPALVQSLLTDVRQLNRERGQTSLRYYPGSPWLAAHHLRAQDRGVFCELVKDEAKLLAHMLAANERMRVENSDGYHALLTQLPPAEKRALVLIDPPYETAADSWSALVKVLKQAHQRFATGVYAVWYPIKKRDEARRFHRLLRDSGLRDVCFAEMTVFEDVANVGLNGSGVAFINPPYQLLDGLRAALPPLWRQLSARGAGAVEIDVIVGE